MSEQIPDQQKLGLKSRPASEYQCVEVDLGEKSYPIHIGYRLLQETGALIAEALPGSRCAIITDKNVADLHLATLGKSLEAHDVDYSVITVEAGEASKSFAVFERVVGEVLDGRFERSDIVIGFGGGVVGDLAGYVAASIRRGMNFVQIPTSLLAQVDSSVGGKTGINAKQGKNLVGAFLQPKMVIADIDLLRSLPEREFRAGYAEMVKYGLIDKPEFFERLEQSWEQVFSFGPELIDAVATSCQAKADVVSQDEFEQGRRALLNLGHTFGHALEGATKYDSSRLVHGEGVSIGIVLAHEYSNKMNLCDADSVSRVRTHFDQVGLPVSIGQIPGEMPDAEGLMDYIFQDKKVSKGKLTFILTKGLGNSYIANDVIPDEILSFLKEKL